VTPEEREAQRTTYCPICYAEARVPCRTRGVPVEILRQPHRARVKKWEQDEKEDKTS